MKGNTKRVYDNDIFIIKRCQGTETHGATKVFRVEKKLYEKVTMHVYSQFPRWDPGRTEFTRAIE